MPTIKDQIIAIITKEKTFAGRMARIRKEKNAQIIIDDLLEKGFSCYTRFISYANKRDLKSEREESAVLTERFKAAIAKDIFEAWTLSSGKTLGAATRIDLAKEATREENLAYGHTRNVFFYQELASNLDDDETPVDSLPLILVESIKKRIYEGYKGVSQPGSDVHGERDAPAH